LALLAVAVDLPLVWTLLASVGIVSDVGHRPPTFDVAPTGEHLAEVGRSAPEFIGQVGLTLVISTAASLIAVAFAFLAAYALVRGRPGRTRHRTVRQAALIAASVPVLGYVLALGEIERRVGLDDSVIGVSLAEAAATAPLALYVLAGFLEQMPRDIEEAAALDGAGPAQILARIVAPVSREILAATLVVLFVLNWNQLLIPLIVAGVNVQTVPVAMIDFFTFERELDWPTAAAALVVSAAPAVIAIAAFNRFLGRFRLWDPNSAA
jgi:ABC-type glycerol-3-phosphate transport system permease component